MNKRLNKFAFHLLSARSNGALLSSMALLFVFASSCGSDKKKAGTGSGTVTTGTANENAGKSADLSVSFPKLTTDTVIEEKSVYNIELVFPQNAGSGKWSLYVSERENGFVGAIPVAKDLPLTQSTFEWNTADVVPSRYYVTIAVEYAGEIRLFQAPGVVVVTSKGKNAQPYARIVSPNNTFTINNLNEVQPINNNNARQRFSAGEPLRIRYKYLEPDGEAVTLSLEVSANNRDWQKVLEKFSPGQPVTPGGDEYIVEWTPPVDIDKNVYTLRLGISDGKSETFTDQPNIGIGDISYNGEISALLTKSCASAGCHNAASAPQSRNIDLSRYDDIPQVNVTGYDGQVKMDLDSNCVSCHGATNPQKGVRLDTFEFASAAAATIKTVLDNNTMPVQVVPPATPAPTPTPDPAVTPDPAATPTPAPTAAPVVYQPRALDAAVKTRILQWIAQGAVRTSQTTQQAIRGAVGVQSYETVLVTNWLSPKGSQQRDRRAMPRGPAPLPPEVLGKFLNWEMRGTNWNDANKQYQNVDAERRRRD
jgi:hypothetical protein